MSAPISCRDRDDPDGNAPKWKTPCGQEFLVDNSSGGSSSGENDTEIMSSILTSARLALDYMQNFRENYFQVTLGSCYNMQKDIARHQHDWLPNKETEVPKHIGEKVDPSHLECQRFDQFLQNMYQWMQMYAVGIEQVVLDQQKTGGKFRKELTDTESNLRKVLCELRMGMYSKNIVPQNKVGRCIMDEATRNINATAQRNLRDWVIFRESMNGLEYLIQVLEYLDAKSSS